jgi:hypothetical protein
LPEQQQRVSLSDPPVAPETQPGGVDYVPPSDLVPLPSRGLVYPPDSPLHGVTELEVRPMGAHEEDIITSRALLKQGRAIGMLIRSCLVNKAIDPDQMLVGDRNAVLVAIRVTGYGPEYRVEVTCPGCGETKADHEFDLSSLPIDFLETPPLQPGQNLFSCHLPSLGKTCVFRLPTGADDREVSVALERAKKNQGGLEPGVTVRLLQQVVSVGEVGQGDKRLHQLITRMNARDTRAVRKAIRDLQPGIEMRQPFACPACGAETEVDVPLGAEFFWPSD